MVGMGGGDQLIHEQAKNFKPATYFLSFNLDLSSKKSQKHLKVISIRCLILPGYQLVNYLFIQVTPDV